MDCPRRCHTGRGHWNGADAARSFRTPEILNPLCVFVFVFVCAAARRSGPQRDAYDGVQRDLDARRLVARAAHQVRVEDAQHALRHEAESRATDTRNLARAAIDPKRQDGGRTNDSSFMEPIRAIWCL